jgi:hypothetical protein
MLRLREIEPGTRLKGTRTRRTYTVVGISTNPIGDEVELRVDGINICPHCGQTMTTPSCILSSGELEVADSKDEWTPGVLYYIESH